LKVESCKFSILLGVAVNLIIQPLSQNQIEDAKDVVTEGCFEFFGRPPLDFEDMENVSPHYIAPSGIFWCCWIKIA